jgi:hypothetical protein
VGVGTFISGYMQVRYSATFGDPGPTKVAYPKSRTRSQIKHLDGRSSTS